MTELQQKQYDRFILAGYPPDMAAPLIARGAWLGTQEMLPEAVEDINGYRTERDVRVDQDRDERNP